jgi:hypothetical protein
VAVLMAAMLAAAPALAQGKPLNCVLWPRTCDQPSVALPPAVTPPAFTPEPESVPVPPPAPARRAPPPARRKPVPNKSVAKAPPHPPAAKAPVCSSAGPDLPWPCWMVRMQSGGKSNAQLAAEGRARGIKLSCKQERQALACLGRT